MRQLSLFDVDIPDRPTYQPKVETDTILLIDGNNLLNRAFYATFNNRPLTAPDGRPTNGVMSFMRMLLNYQKTYNAQAFVFFDEGKGFRKELFPAYKEGRNEKPMELKQQFPIVYEVLAAAGIPIFKDAYYEADDLIACAAKHTPGKKIIVSNDKDLLQLLSEDVSVLSRKGDSDIIITPELFREMYEGLNPIQITDLKAIEGDSSDNIEGIIGIGKKGAMKIIQTAGDIQSLTHLEDWTAIKRYQKYFDEQGLKRALFFKELTTLKNDKPIMLNRYEIERERLIKVCKTLNLQSIMNMI